MVAPKSIQEDKNLMNPSQVAEKLGVDRTTVHNWIKSGMLRSERHGAFHAIHVKELHRFSKVYTIADHELAPVAKAEKKAPKKKGKAKKAKAKKAKAKKGARA